MSKSLLYIVGIQLILLTGNSLSCAQNKFIDQPVLHEKVEIITDRDIYITGETVYFKILNLSDSILKEIGWSEVVYLELITPEGLPLSQGKFKFGSGGSQGKLEIPEGLLSGNYYLKAYTKWIRNFTPIVYSYKLLSIVNPFNDEVISNTSENNTDWKIITQPVDNKESEVVITNKEIFGKREKVHVRVSPQNDLPEGYYTVSVVKKDLIKNLSVLNKKAGIVPDKIRFIPETQGISLSGFVAEGKDTNAIRYNLVHLTLFDGKTVNQGIISDENGKFYFNLPDANSNIELFINASSANSDNDPLIFVDNDYCKQSVALPFIPFNPDGQEKKAIKELSINVQLKKQFLTSDSEEYTVQSKRDRDSNDIYFYGKPDFKLEFDKFIQLPGLKDYFDELIPFVSVRQKNKRKYLKVLGLSNDLGIYEPLMLVDMVAISDASGILEIDPKKVESIEVIRQPYIKGNVTYGGIIHIISKEKDFAGVDLPSSGQFFKFDMLDSAYHSFNINPPQNKHFPDVRNCLYWNASMKLTPDKNTEFDFYTGDTRGTYLILIRRYRNDGSPLSFQKSFVVE